MVDIIFRAAQFARKAHSGHVKKRTALPYFLHPARVAGIVASLDGATDVMVAAAYLHDVLDVDYGDVPAEALERNFPQDVVRMVIDLTDHYTKDRYPGTNRAARKEAECARLSGVPPQAKAIKIVDRLDDLLDLDLSGGFARVYLDESVLLLGAVQDGDAEMARRLCALIGTLRSRIVGAACASRVRTPLKSAVRARVEQLNRFGASSGGKTTLQDRQTP